MTDAKTVALPVRVARIRFQRVGKLYHFDCGMFDNLQKDDYVIVETMRGRQMGQVVDFAAPDGSLDEYKPIMRIATPAELLAGYTAQAGSPPSAERGKKLFTTNFGKELGLACSSCHTANPLQPGKDDVTEKPIAPLSPAASTPWTCSACQSASRLSRVAMMVRLAGF